MFGLSIGWFEIFAITCVALMVLGPEKFPQVAKLVMKSYRDIRKYMSDAQRDIATELNPLKSDLKKFSKVDIEKYLENLMEDDKDKPSSESEPDAFSDDEVMLTPDEYDNPEEWFQEDDMYPDEDGQADINDGIITETEVVEESVAYDPDASSTDEEDSFEEVIDPEDPERLDY